MAPKSERAQLVAELRRIAASEPRFTYDWLHRQDRPLLQRLLTEFGDLARARKAAGLRPLDPIRKWTEERLIEEMRSVYRATGALTAKAIIEAGRHDLVGATQAHGGLIRARRLAGLPEPAPVRRGRGEPCERVLEELRARPAPASRLRHHVRRAAERHFGSVPAALEAAGITTRFGRWDKATVIAELREAARGDGRIREALALAAARQFGSITEARRAAGVPLLHQRWTRDLVITEVRRHGARGLPEQLRSACDRFFGSVADARRAAGVDAPQRTWTAERVLAELRTKWADRAAKGAVVTACARFFGSVAAARKAAKLVPLTEKWDEARVIRLLREREVKGAELPGHTYNYAEKFFGSFEAACQAAGVPVRRKARQQ